MTAAVPSFLCSPVSLICRCHESARHRPPMFYTVSASCKTSSCAAHVFVGLKRAGCPLWRDMLLQKTLIKELILEPRDLGKNIKDIVK